MKKGKLKEKIVVALILTFLLTCLVIPFGKAWDLTATVEETGTGYQVIEIEDNHYANNGYQMSPPNTQCVFYVNDRFYITNQRLWEDYHVLTASSSDLTDWDVHNETATVDLYGYDYYGQDMDSEYLYLVFWEAGGNDNYYYRGTLNGDGSITWGSIDDTFDSNSGIVLGLDVAWTLDKKKFVGGNYRWNSMNWTACLDVSDLTGAFYSASGSDPEIQNLQNDGDTDKEYVAVDVDRYRNDTLSSYVVWYEKDEPLYSRVDNWTDSPDPHTITNLWNTSIYPAYEPKNESSFTMVSNDLTQTGYVVYTSTTNQHRLIIQDLSDGSTDVEYLELDTVGVDSHGVGVMRYNYRGHDNVYCFYINEETTGNFTLNLRIYRNGDLTDEITLLEYESTEYIANLNVVKKLDNEGLDNGDYSNLMGGLTFLRNDSGGNFDLVGYFFDLPDPDENDYEYYPFILDPDSFWFDDYFLLFAGLLGLTMIVTSFTYGAYKIKEGEISTGVAYALMFILIGYGLVVVWLWS